MYDNNPTKCGRREMEVYYCKVSKLYMKWYLKNDYDYLNIKVATEITK